MARFTVAENELMMKIRDDRFTSTLAKIREAVEDLWPNDPVRIVLHYTDHGVKHSERVASYASLILKANKGRPFSDQEMYLLLASIYLHDIGMQCDVVKFPKIVDIAEKMGARFDKKFELANGVFNKEMQKSIRKNHQYLSAAWIDHASRTGDTRLGTAIQDIPSYLIDDLMDICKYHSQLSIKKCPIKFNFFEKDRKQLVAAVLRFADELDIDAQRISLETVKNFSIEPDNSVYWWLHNRTYITFITPCVISMILQLHPIDNKNYGRLIRYLFIEKFCKKNEPLIDILCENYIPLHISSDSRIKENDRIELLPEYIITAIKKLKRHDESSDEIDKVNHLCDSSFALSETNNGTALENLGRCKDALEAHESPSKQDQNDASCWIHMGMVLENSGRYKEAIATYKNAIELEPNYLSTWTSKVSSLEKLCRIKASEEFKEIEAYLETEKEIFEELEIQALQKEEATLLSLMDLEAEKEAEMEFHHWQDSNFHLVEEQESILSRKNEEERTVFLKNMQALAKEDKAIETAESQESATYLETEREILDEIEIQALQKAEATILSLMDLEADKEAEMEFDQWQDAEISLIEKGAAFLNRAKKEELAAFLKKSEELAKEERAIEIAESQESATYLETEKEIFEEMVIQALQKEEVSLLSLMDLEADKETEMESEQWQCADIYLIEKGAAFHDRAKKEERAAFLKKSEELAKEERAIEIAESQESATYLETEKEIFEEMEIQAIQKEGASLLSLMDREANKEAEMEFEQWGDINIQHVEEPEAFLNRAKEEETAAFLKKSEELAKEEWAIEIAESQESATYLETEKEIFEEMEIQALQKEEASLLSLMDREADKEAEREYEQGQDIDSDLAEERAAFLNRMNEDAMEEKDIENYLDTVMG